MNTDAILKNVLTIVLDLINDWELGYQGELGPDTTLIGDLSLESIDIVQLSAAIEEYFAPEGLPFEKLLLRKGRYVDDLRIGQIVDFLTEHLRSRGGM